MDSPHRAVIDKTCKPEETPWLQRIDYVNGAVRYKERNKFPSLGLSVTRRVLRTLAQTYSDKNIKCLVCFICGEQRTTGQGLPHPNFEDPSETPRAQQEIKYVDQRYFDYIEKNIRDRC